MRTRFVRIAVLALVPVLLAGACSSGGGGGSSAGLVAAVTSAATKTAEAKTARVFMVTSVTGQQKFTVEATGRMEIGGRRGVISVDMASVGLTGGSGKVEMRIIGTTAYMQVPPQLAKQVPAGKKWLKIDYAAIAKDRNVDVTALQRNFQTGDPAAVLGFLRGVGSVTEAGTETIRGTKTTHYKATVDFDQVVAKAEASARNDVKKLVESIGIKRMPIEVWIAADGLLRRLQFTMDLSKLNKTGVSGDLGLKMELYEFGVDVSDVVAPPAGEVVDIQQLLTPRS